MHGQALQREVFPVGKARAAICFHSLSSFESERHRARPMFPSVAGTSKAAMVDPLLRSASECAEDNEAFPFASGGDQLPTARRFLTMTNDLPQVLAYLGPGPA